MVVSYYLEIIDLEIQLGSVRVDGNWTANRDLSIAEVKVIKEIMTVELECVLCSSQNRKKKKRVAYTP